MTFMQRVAVLAVLAMALVAMAAGIVTVGHRELGARQGSLDVGASAVVQVAAR